MTDRPPPGTAIHDGRDRLAAGPRASDPDLLRRIRDEIRRDGPIPFARFMELALYDADHGYYAADAGRIGTDGDYVTASDAGTVLGGCLGRQLVEMDRLLGRPEPFTLVEHGAGRGLLARDVLDLLPSIDRSLARRLQVVLVDRSAAMRAASRASVPEARVVEPGAELPRYVGCALAVELFDALPVHRLVRRAGRLREVRVGLAGEELVEVEGAPAAVASELARRYGAAPAEGDQAEVAPSAPAIFDRLVEGLAQGFALVIDYGHPAPTLYSPRHRRGTVLAYRGHATSEKLLDCVGRQDLTAHVNFTQLEDRARQAGLAPLGLTTQDRFLIANGVIEIFEQHDPRDVHDPRRVRRRQQALELIHPARMGRRFRVAVFARGFEPPPALAGLVDPFARDG